MGKEVWELRKEEEGSTANERVRGRDCTPLSPGGCDHMWLVVTLPSSCHPTCAGHLLTSHELHVLSASPEWVGGPWGSTWGPSTSPKPHPQPLGRMNG